MLNAFASNFTLIVYWPKTVIILKNCTDHVFHSHCSSINLFSFFFCYSLHPINKCTLAPFYLYRALKGRFRIQRVFSIHSTEQELLSQHGSTNQALVRVRRCFAALRIITLTGLILQRISTKNFFYSMQWAQYANINRKSQKT